MRNAFLILLCLLALGAAYWYQSIQPAAHDLGSEGYYRLSELAEQSGGRQEEAIIAIARALEVEQQDPNQYFIRIAQGAPAAHLTFDLIHESILDVQWFWVEKFRDRKASYNLLTKKLSFTEAE